MPKFCSDGMKYNWFKSLMASLCSDVSRWPLYLPKRWSLKGLWDLRKVKNGSVYKDTDFYRCETTMQASLKVQVFGGSGNVVLFVLSEHCVSSWFSMLVEEWGLHRPPLVKVFHSGESSDVNGIQRVCRFCLWRR